MQSTTATTTTLSTVPKISWNSLQLGDLIGNGSFGDVYQGIWNDKAVAIKLLQMKTLTPNLLTDFNKEAQLMWECQSDNTLSLHGICVESDHCAMVTEYMGQGSLYSVINNQALSEEQCWQITLDMAKGLSFIHSKDIIHRDFKSFNVLIDDNYQAKICNFGLAKLKTAIASGSTSAKKTGSVRWKAPELFKFKSVATKASDIYSFGMVLWELASKKLPFAQGVDDATVISWIKDGAQEAIPEDCPEAWKNIIKSCWAAAELRPSAIEIVAQLEAAMPKSSQSISEDKSWHFATKLDSSQMQSNYALLKGEQAEQELAAIAVAKEQAAEEIVKAKKTKTRTKRKDKAHAKQKDKVHVKRKAKRIKIKAEQEALTDKNKAEQRLAAAKAAQLQAEQAAALATPKLASAGPHIAYPAPLNNQFTPGYSDQTTTTTTAANTAAATPAVNQQQLQKFLQLVAEGEQDQAEAMLQQNQALALHAGNVTDLSGSSFTNITGFQYAVWALDWHMWKMILLNLPEDAARAQIKGMETGSWVATHDISASWQHLIDALDEFIRLCNEGRWVAADNQWNRGVGDAQRLLPAHVINEYCHPERPFYPCPSFRETALPRSRKTDEGEWFTAKYNGSTTGGGGFAAGRGSWRTIARRGEVGGEAVCDRTALDTLLKTRMQQRDQLLQDYAPTSSKKFGL